MDQRRFVYLMVAGYTRYGHESLETTASEIWACMQHWGGCPAGKITDASNEQMWWKNRISMNATLLEEAGYRIWRSMKLRGRPDRELYQLDEKEFFKEH